MHKKTFNRLIYTIGISMLVISGIIIILYNLNNNIIFFYPPSKLPINSDNKILRIGGIVQEDSIKNISSSEIKFIIKDDIANVEVYFKGIPPSLFRENQGLVVKGKFRDQIFVAKEILVKHDERYYP